MKFRLQVTKSVQILQKSEQAKQNILFDIDKKTIVDFTKSSFTVLIAASSMISLSIIVNRMNPTTIDEFPYNMIFFLYNSIIPSSATCSLLVAYYLRNFIILKSICREIKILLRIEEPLWFLEHFFVCNPRIRVT